MKKIVLWMIGMVFGWIQGIQAQQVKFCFVNMPDSVYPLFTSVNRADFIDFLESNMKAEVTNRLGGKSEMTVLAADYLSIQTTPQSTWQMKVLPVNDSIHVICTVSTVCAPACDSHIRFYTTLWKELPAADFLPSDRLTMDDFLKPAADTIDVYQTQEMRRQADLLLLKASLSAKEPTLTFQCTTPDYMEQKMGEQLRASIRPSIVWVWQDGRFVWKE